MIHSALKISVLALLLTGQSLAGDQPSFIIILADDLGTDNVTYLPDHPTPAQTPVIDALAAQSIVFRNGYANPNCSPSRASLLTGQNAWRLSVGNPLIASVPVGGLDVTTPTIASALGPSYRRVFLGKWHVSDLSQTGPPSNPPALTPPMLMGFDSFRGTWNNLGGGGGGYSNWQKQVDNNPAIHVTDYITTDTINDAIFEVDNADGPLLMWVALHAPHAPFHDPPAMLHGVDTSSGTDTVFYKAMAETMDTEVGRLIDALAVSSIADSTYVIFLGDNGTPGIVTELPWDPDHAKGTAYQGGVRVPFLVSGPGVLPHTSRSLVSVTDIFATITELASNPQGAADSVSLVPYFAGPRPSIRRIITSERYAPNGLLAPGVQVNTFHRMARDSQFKLVVWYDGPFQNQSGLALFDLNRDPLETYDLLMMPMSLTTEARLSYDALRDRLNTIGGGHFPLVP